MITVRFTKMHGCGNDYIYVNTMEQTIDNPSAAAIAWSDRHKGIGSDGLVLIGPSPIPEADFSMRIFNADGSEAMMCGNASRCIGKYVYERGLTDKTVVRLLTLSGIKTLQLNLTSSETEDDGGTRQKTVESVTVDMGEPIKEDTSLFDQEKAKGMPSPVALWNGTEGNAVFISMGNPHFVIFTDDVEQVETLGKSLEFHPAFPKRCNIEFAHILDDGTIRTRVWERGSGITMACGTGACATAVAAAITGRASRHSQIVMDGGSLIIEWRKDNHVSMTGPATIVYEGEIESVE